jgi:hypothetical protein
LFPAASPPAPSVIVGLAAAFFCEKWIAGAEGEKGVGTPVLCTGASMNGLLGMVTEVDS